MGLLVYKFMEFIRLIELIEVIKLMINICIALIN